MLGILRGGSRKNIWGAWPLIICEATMAKQNYYRTIYIKHVEKLGLNYPEKKFILRRTVHVVHVDRLVKFKG